MNGIPRFRNSLIERSELDSCPFPHFVCDGILDRNILELIDQNWPAIDVFNETGLPGNAMFLFSSGWDSLSNNQQTFWHELCWHQLKQIYEATFKKYYKFYINKYGELLKHINVHVRLMEMHSNFIDHEIHTHHWHDPCWLFTNLIYIDESHDVLPGTTLFGTPRAINFNDQAKIAAQTLVWEDMEEDVIPSKTVEYQSNRMLSFIDSPVSYHGVLETQQQPETRSRRVIRCHASAPIDLIPKLYDMAPEEYRLHRRRASKKHFVIDMLEKEITTLFQPSFLDETAKFNATMNNITMTLDVP